MNIYILCLCIVLAIVHDSSGHGKMVDPVNRSTIWRENSSFPQNTDDNALYCGGFWTQYGLNDGKCGICGDNYRDARPRANENGGTFGLGYIVKTYPHNSVINIRTDIAQSHKGYFQFQLCMLKCEKELEEEDCFEPLFFEDGSDRQIVDKSGIYENKVVLPEDYTCEHCVLRWHYKAGNNWGECEDGTHAVGCGNQETFRSCADIAIL